MGSGVGLLGLTCLKLNQSLKHFVFTDSHNLVLEKINKNLNYNKIEPNRTSVLQLDWTIDLNEQLNNLENIHSIVSNLDFILATGNYFLWLLVQ